MDVGIKLLLGVVYIWENILPAKSPCACEWAMKYCQGIIMIVRACGIYLQSKSIKAELR